MKRFLPLIAIIAVMLTTCQQAWAVYDPRSVPNNIYGIHVIDENDLANAASLVNSSGGDWGYVTIVIPERERSVDKWNGTFEKMAYYHLIPLIRIGTNVEGNYWAKPDESQIQSWVDFLNGLKWYTKNRYVILFNEPNHAKEWGMDVNPAEYARIAKSFSEKLKSRSEDFFIMMAGLDASAPNGKETVDEVKFMKGMVAETPDIFNYFDGWVSHSYPNPGFTGSVKAVGRGTIRNFQWEREMLRSLGINRNLPIFITETGWPHDEGSTYNKYLSNPDEVAEQILYTAENVWNDSDIVAVTPFVLNYTTDPFSNFSWMKPDGSGSYPQFDAYKSIPKTSGKPDLVEPSVTVTPENVQGLTIENLSVAGQTGLKSDQGVKLDIFGFFMTQLNRFKSIF